MPLEQAGSGGWSSRHTLGEEGDEQGHRESAEEGLESRYRRARRSRGGEGDRAVADAVGIGLEVGQEAGSRQITENVADLLTP